MNSDQQDAAVIDGDAAHRDLALMRASVESYTRASLVRGASVDPLDAWIPNFYSRHNLTQVDVTVGAILQCFAFQLSEMTGWQYSEADGAMSPWHLQRWCCIGKVMFVARLDLIGRSWVAYCFPVPGVKHEDEVELWRTNGVQLDPKHAAALFDVPWLKYKW